MKIFSLKTLITCTITGCLLSSSLLIAEEKHEPKTDPITAMKADPLPSKDLLPEEFKVYYKKNLGISKISFKGSSEKLIPTSNLYEGNPGCYIACYSKNKLEGAYHLLDKVYLMGQIRVQGKYANGLCIPKGYEDKDMRTAKEFKDKCELEFPAKCKEGSCWAGGKTAEWF